MCFAKVIRPTLWSSRRESQSDRERVRWTPRGAMVQRGPRPCGGEAAIPLCTGEAYLEQGHLFAVRRFMTSVLRERRSGGGQRIAVLGTRSEETGLNRYHLSPPGGVLALLRLGDTHGVALPAAVGLSVLSSHHRPSEPGGHHEGLAAVAPAPPELLPVPRALTRALSPHVGL